MFPLIANVHPNGETTSDLIISHPCLPVDKYDIVHVILLQ